MGGGETRIPKTAGANAFAHNKIGLAGVTQVYVRKHGLTTSNQDDALRLSSVEVILTDDASSRFFSLQGAITLSIEGGLAVWLKEYES